MTENHDISRSVCCPAPAASTIGFDTAIGIHERPVFADLSENLTANQYMSIDTSSPSVVTSTNSKFSHLNHNTEETTIYSSSPLFPSVNFQDGLDVHSSGNILDQSIEHDPFTLNSSIGETVSESVSVVSSNFSKEVLTHENLEKMSSTTTEGSIHKDLASSDHSENLGTQSDKDTSISATTQLADMEGLFGVSLMMTEEHNKESEPEKPSCNSLKRIYESFVNDTQESEVVTPTVSKRSKCNSKNVTPASQHRKLASPFRSPLLIKPYKNVDANGKFYGANNVSKQDGQSSDSRMDLQKTPFSNTLPSSNTSKSTPQKSSNLSRGVLLSSFKAASPFKSPFSGKSTSCEKAPSRSQSNPNIQILERKVLSLKRALQIKKDDNEERLRFLIQKWRNVGREVAWELWQIVRESKQENQNPSYRCNQMSQSKSFYESNDWKNRSPHSSSADRLQCNWGWDVIDKNESNDDSESELATSTPSNKLKDEFPRIVTYALDDLNDRDVAPKVTESVGDSEKESLGGMLISLEIPHQTLGWVEEEGDFLDGKDD